MEKRSHTIKSLSKFLVEQSKIIKEQSFRREQINRIMHDLKGILINLSNKEKHTSPKDHNELIFAFFEFKIAIEISLSKYRKENKNMWTTIFGFWASKIPKLDLESIFK